MTESFAELFAEQQQQSKIKVQEELKRQEEESRKKLLIRNWRNRNYTFSDKTLNTDENIFRIIGIQNNKVNCPTCNATGLVPEGKCPTCKSNPHYLKGKGFTFLVDGKPCTHEWTFGFTESSSRLSNTARICIHCGYNYDNYTD